MWLLRNSKTIAKAAASVFVLAAAWYFLAPSQLGGGNSYVITYGTSMQPVYHAGDLAVVRTASSYHVGEIVAYRNMALDGKVVLHRIIGIDNGRYTFKGDNNHFVDSFHPTRSELVGRLWFHVPSIGKYLLSLHGPRLFLLAGLAGLIALAGIAFSGRKRLRRGRSVEVPEVVATGSRLPLFGAFHLAAIGALAVFAALAAAAYTRPLTKHSVQQGLYTQSGQFTYSADLARRSPVYRGARVATGQPIFLSLVHEARFQFSYGFHTKAPHQVFGHASLRATVTGTDGWTRTLVLAPSQSFEGDRVTVGGQLDLDALKSLLGEVAALSNVSGATYTLTLAPHVTLTGAVAGDPLHESFAPTLPFLLDSYQLQLQPGSVAGPSSASLLTPTASGSGPAVVANTIALTKLRLHVAVVRRIALYGAAGALLAFFAGLLVALRRQPVGEAAQIDRRFGDLIVKVTETPHGLELPSVSLDSIDGLVRVAEQSARMILHLEHEGSDVYFIEDGGFVYTYQAKSETVAFGSEPVGGSASDESPVAPLQVIRHR